MSNPGSNARIRLRPATRADVPLILQLVRELAEYEKSPEQVVATEEKLDRYLFGDGFGRGPVVECLIGEIDGTAQGFALYFSNFSTWLSTSGIYLEDLFVRPAFRGRGLGKALLARLAQIAVERGCGRLEWAVLNWNEPAIGFYKSLGAAPMDEWTVFRMTGDALGRLGGAERGSP
jgi:GNAT superfamily N-acetyltransferase